MPRDSNIITTTMSPSTSASSASAPQNPASTPPHLLLLQHLLPPELHLHIISFQIKKLPFRCLSSYWDNLITCHFHFDTLRMMRNPETLMRHYDASVAESRTKGSPTAEPAFEKSTSTSTTTGTPSRPPRSTLNFIPRHIHTLIINSSLCSVAQFHTISPLLIKWTKSHSHENPQTPSPLHHIHTISFYGHLPHFNAADWKHTTVKALHFKGSVASLNTEDDTSRIDSLRQIMMHGVLLNSELILECFIRMIGRFPNLVSIQLGAINDISWRHLKLLFEILGRKPLTDLHLGWFHCKPETGRGVLLNQRRRPNSRLRIPSSGEDSDSLVQPVPRASQSVTPSTGRGHLQPDTVSLLMPQLIDRISPTVESLRLGTFASSQHASRIRRRFRIFTPLMYPQLIKCHKLKKLSIHVPNQQRENDDAQDDLPCIPNLESLRIVCKDDCPLHLAPPLLHSLEVLCDFFHFDLSRFHSLKELNLTAHLGFNGHRLLQGMENNVQTLKKLCLHGQLPERESDLSTTQNFDSPNIISMKETADFLSLLQQMEHLEHLELTTPAVTIHFSHRISPLQKLKYLKLHTSRFVAEQLEDAIVDSPPVYPHHETPSKEQHIPPVLSALQVLTIGDLAVNNVSIGDPLLGAQAPRLRELYWNDWGVSLETLPSNLSHIHIIHINCFKLRDLNLCVYPSLDSFQICLYADQFSFSLNQVLKLVHNTRSCSYFNIIFGDYAESEFAQNLEQMLEGRDVKERLELFLKYIEEEHKRQHDGEIQEELLQPFRELQDKWRVQEVHEIREKPLPLNLMPSSYNWFLKLCTSSWF